jgi:hypothetical protein
VTFQFGFDPIDVGPLLLNLLVIESPSDTDPFGVVGNGDVFESPIDSSIGHRIERIATVGRVGVHMQIASDI